MDERPGASPEIDGPRDGLPVVFLHGTRLSRTMWRPVARRLAGWYRIIAVDLPGHGTRADVPFTMETAIDDVAATIDREAGGSAVLVGLSLGGYVAMEVAARHPTKVRALVLSGASQDPVGFWSLGFHLLAAVLGRAPAGPLDALNRWFFRVRYPRDVAQDVLAGGLWARGGARAVKVVSGRVYAPTLAAYPGPVLLLNGGLDIVFRAGEGRFLGAARDGSRTVIRGATHLASLDRPGAFAAAIRRFLRDRLSDGAVG